MKTHELKKILKKHGCYFLEEGGNHEKWYSPKTGIVFTVWRHKGEISTGTVEAILKEAGLK